jgi:hypothetical protein
MATFPGFREAFRLGEMVVPDLRGGLPLTLRLYLWSLEGWFSGSKGVGAVARPVMAAFPCPSGTIPPTPGTENPSDIDRKTRITMKVIQQ